jgi:LysM repeat protein
MVSLGSAVLGSVAVPILTGSPAHAAATPTGRAVPGVVPPDGAVRPPDRGIQPEVETPMVRHAAKSMKRQAPVTAASSARPAAAKQYRVKSGDTLYGIAAEMLGDGAQYPAIFAANEGRVESDGERFDNPDLIMPDWVLDIPDATAGSGTQDRSGTQDPNGKHAATPDPGSPKTVEQGGPQPSGPQNGERRDTSQDPPPQDQKKPADSSQSDSSQSDTDWQSGNLDSWIDRARGILAANGIQVSHDAIATTAMHESSGDPSAVNNWDGNAAAGHPSIGLMQTIQPTFDAYALDGYRDIYNPIDNIIAAVRYANDRYGSLEDVVAGQCGGDCWHGY